MKIRSTDIRRIAEHIGATDRIRSFFRDCATLVELWSAWYHNRYRDISRPSVVILLLAFLYLINPLDILPDLIPLLGWLDDAAVIKIVADALRRELSRFRIWQNWMDDQTNRHSFDR